MIIDIETFIKMHSIDILTFWYTFNVSH